MLNELFRLLNSFEPRGILLDTNLLVVYIVGLTDLGKVGVVRRTEAYEPKDARFLLQLLPRYATRFTTPGILAEATNLLRPFFDKLAIERRTTVQSSLREELRLTEEVFIPAKELAQDDALLRYGFTDLAVAALAGRQMIVLTADAPLAQLLESRQLPCVNYNQIRFLLP
jgi:hypothetical protein